MSFSLQALGNADQVLTLNAWTWRPLLDYMRDILDLDAERYERLDVNGGAQISAPEAQRIAAALRAYVLVDLKPGERILYDRTVTAEPDDYVLHRTPDTMWKNYSVTYETLVRFIEFCETSQGFEIW